MKLGHRYLLLFVFPFLLFSCQKQDAVSSASQEKTSSFQSLSASSYRLMTPAYYRTAEDGKSIRVRFYESPRIFELSTATAGFQQTKALIDAARNSKTVLRVYSENVNKPYVSLQRAEAPSSDEIKKETTGKQPLYDSTTLKTVIPNTKILDSIFKFCAQQGCTTNTVVIDYCIPFQYKVDGCFARAHKMRQIITERYNYNCEKILSYEGENGNLVVDAGDCCVQWWYHMAPLVTVHTKKGNQKYVIDPSLFGGPVTIKTWLSVQQNRTCNPDADFGYYEIQPGYVYAPNGWRDDDYSNTNFYLQLYADAITCYNG